MTRPTKKRGILIVFEGPEGSGKTTHIQHLAEHFRRLGHMVRITREPGGTELGDGVRNLLLARHQTMSAETELTLLLAQRIEHTRQVLRPALAAGEVVLCDRHADSSRVYQGLARGLGLELVNRLHKALKCEVRAHLTVLMDLDPQIGLARAAVARKRALDRIEAEAMAFHRRVRQGYLKLAKAEPRRFLVIDADGTPDEVFARLLAGLEHRKILVMKQKPVGRRMNTLAGTPKRLTSRRGPSTRR